MTIPLSAFVLLSILTVIGALGLWLGSRKMAREKRHENLVKFITYILLLGGITWVFFLGKTYRYVLFALITAAAICEVGNLYWKRHKQSKLLSLLPILPAFLGILMSYPIDDSLLFFIYLTVVIFDAFCQVWGQLVGRTKLVPKISPAKTAEGLFFGAITTFFASWYIRALLPDKVSFFLLFPAVLVLAFLGDILASWIKRKLGVKDFSRMLPGQGGIMDRFDSYIFCAGYISLFIRVFGIE